MIIENPFDQEIQTAKLTIDPLLINNFRLYLLGNKLSKTTIKNYIVDVRQFLDWLQKVAPKNTSFTHKIAILNNIDSFVIEEYKNRLSFDAHMSSASINRKLSSLRNYISWLGNKNIKISKIPNKNPGFMILNKIQSQNNQKIYDNNVTTPKNYPVINNIFLKSWNIISDLIIVAPTVNLIQKFQNLIWAIKGKNIFDDKKLKIYNNTSNIQINIAKSIKKNAIHNIPKSAYAPLSISIKELPVYKKIYFHLRHTRPKWYKIYHKYPISTYLHLGILIISTTLFGYLIYNSLYGDLEKHNLVIASPAPIPKSLAIRGIITDAANNPITSATPLRFAIYNDQYSSGSALLWQEVQSITPEQDGKFSAIIGRNNDLTASIFAENPNLFLGLTVATDHELKPRQQLAAISYSSNAQKLQGLLPITQNGSGTNNVVLALDSVGNLTIGGNANPTFEASGGKFTISGKTLALFSAAGSDTNIEIAPDGKGIIDLQKALQNTTNNNNIESSQGAVEIDDLLAILATSSGQSALTINQNSTGPIISASSSGTAKFTLENDGSGTFAGNLFVNGDNLTSANTSFNLLNTNTINLNIAGSATSISLGANTGSTNINNTLFANGGITVPANRSLIVSGNIASSLIPFINQTYDLGSKTSYWENAYINNLYTSPTATVSGFWQKNNGAISPLNISDDLLIGQADSTGAKFQIFGSGPHAGTASTSGHLTFTKNSQINLINNSDLGIFNSLVGDSGINTANPSLYIASNGNIGIATKNPSSKLDINGDIQAQNLKISAVNVNSTSSSTDLFTASSSGVFKFVIASNGNVGILDASPSNTLKVVGSICVSASTGSCTGNVSGTIYAANTTVQMADVAENYISSENLEPGDIIMSEGKDNNMAISKTITAYQSETIGVVSTRPGITLNSEAATDNAHPFKYPVALSGRVPVKVSSINGEIKIGDYITSSSIHGVGMKAANAGTVIGKALENYTNSNSNQVGKIMVFINLSYFNPSTGYTKEYNFTNNNDSGIDSIKQLSKAVIEDITLGVLQANKIAALYLENTSKNIYLTDSIKNYIAQQIENEVNNIKLNLTAENQQLISPLSSNSAHTITPEFNTDITKIDATLTLSSSDSALPRSAVAFQTASESAQINASLSANLQSQIASGSAQQDIDLYPALQIASDSADANSAPIANLDNLIATNSAQNASPSSQINDAEFIELINNNPRITNSYADLSSLSGQLAYTPNLNTLSDLPQNQLLLDDLNIVNQLNIGGSMILENNAINTLGNALELQPLRQGDLSIMGNLVAIDTHGNLKVSGNALFAKDVAIQGKLTANIIAPVPNSDLIIQLDNNQKDSDSNSTSELVIHNASGNDVFRVNQLGDIVSSGSGTLSRLYANGLNIIRGTQADASLVETIASSSAGTAVITAYETERTIINPFVKTDSLIYLTAASDTQGLTPYIARQTAENLTTNTKASFTIAIPYSISKDIKLNWWIIN